MGEVTSIVKDKSQLDEFLRVYVQDTSYVPAYMTEERLFIHKNDPRMTLLVREFVYGGPALYDVGKQRLLNRLQLVHQNLPQMLGIFDRSNGDWCSHLHILTVAIEQQNSNLKQQMKQRGGSVHSPTSIIAHPVAPFLEAELINIINGVSAAQIALNDSLGCIMADLHPDNIQFDPSGYVKLQDISIYSPDGNTGYLRMLKTNSYRSPLSPEQLNEFAMRSPPSPLISLEKSTVFSLGLIVLGAGTGVSFEYFFDYGNFKIKFNLIQEQLNYMQSLGISRMLVGFVGNMLNEDPNRRPTFALIYESLEKNVKRIF